MKIHLLKSGDKVKMKLVQPDIKCSGRDDVTCYYRGDILDHYGPGYTTYVTIQFKYKGELVTAEYDILDEEFTDKEYKDIKLVSN